MSVFRVNLNNRSQGLLDKHPTTGAQLTTSYQRQVYVMGPNKVNRLLSDGETFTDCNYWKRFCYPQVSLEQAILTCVTDDGSVYSDTGENTYPRVWTLSVAAGSTFADNQVDILTDTGGYAVFCQITNSGTESVSVRLNGSSTAAFTLDNATSQVFNAGDLNISMVEVAHDASGAATTCQIEVLTSIASACNS